MTNLQILPLSPATEVTGWWHSILPDLRMSVHAYPETTCKRISLTVRLVPGLADLQKPEKTYEFQIYVGDAHIPPKHISFSLSSHGETNDLSIDMPLEELPSGVVTPADWTRTMVVILDWLNQVEEADGTMDVEVVKGFCVT